jgi:hypothetical protein
MSDPASFSKDLKTFVHRNWDELTITAALAKVAFSDLDNLNHEDQVILEAFRRSSPVFAQADLADLGKYLSDLDDDQIDGVVNNIKGIAHEIIYVEFENEDGDTITADLFPETNHPGTDVILHNEDTGETWDVQLKATDSEGYVQDWIDAHPDGQILVTEEIAKKMGLESTGVSNEELTTDVEDFIDQALDDDTLWDYVPMLAVASLSIVIYSLYRRYQSGSISKDQFYSMVARATGWKVAKIVLLCTLLSIPVVNVAVGAGLVAKMIISGKAIFSRYQSKHLARHPA